MNRDVESGSSRATADKDAHLDLASIREAQALARADPKNQGRVAAMTARPGSDKRLALETAHLTVSGGMPGDRWARDSTDRPEIQLAVMSFSIASLLANGQPLTLSGDNLILDLDLSDANLPAGTRLKVGSATLEVTPEPHDGCLKFRERFGGDALRFVSEPAKRNLNRRGIYMKVVKDGDVNVGDAIKVIRS